MLIRLSAAWRKFRRALSRSHLTAKLLDNPCRPGTDGPGHLAIQIDGLGRSRFERALRDGRMPFLRSRIGSGDFALRTFYSGMPSSTPAVQAELFYGVRCAVPAFSYIRRSDERRIGLIWPPDADRVVAGLSGAGKPLLSEGTAYGDIFIGGSAEARYCTQTLELDSFFRVVNPIKATLILLLHATTLLRIAGFMLIETGLALVDAVRGLFERRSVFRELAFVPMRVAVCIGLREMVRFRVKNDLLRGIPIIHANFVGYDEQSHRRGPTSAFARWSLKGIDGAIRDIVRSVERSGCREYRVAVYSDHGQEAVESYRETRGETVLDAVRRVLDGESRDEAGQGRVSESKWRYRRARGLLRIHGGSGPGHGRADDDAEAGDGIDRIRVAASGPLGHVYLPGGTFDLEAAARALADAASIPMVLFAEGGRIRAATSDGVFHLKRDAARLLGEDHPLRDRVAADLAELCRHPDAGDLVLSGWRPRGRSLTFPAENGAHGGPGREETRGFVLLPPSMDFGAEVLRPGDLRRLLGGEAEPIRSPAEASAPDSGADPGRGRRTVSPGNPDAPAPASGSASGSAPRRTPDTVRVATYNIHGCRTLDGRVGIGPVAEVLGALAPDLVALQEVDVGRARSGGRDQPAELAAALGMRSRFFPVMRYGSECYGLAILSRFPIRRVRGGRLPAPLGPGRERRGAIRLTVEGPGGEWDLINTHLGLGIPERRRQAAALLSDGWLREGVPAVLCGDLNAGPRSPVCRRIGARLRPAGNGEPTFFSLRPLLRLDHLFVGDRLRVVASGVVRSEAARRASDHLPAWVDLRFDPRVDPGVGGGTP